MYLVQDFTQLLKVLIALLRLWIYPYMFLVKIIVMLSPRMVNNEVSLFHHYFLRIDAQANAFRKLVVFMRLVLFMR